MPNKTVLAESATISRRSLYYVPKQPTKDWDTKQLIELALRDHPSYGHKRLAIHLGINKKRALRVMKLFGIKPYRRVTAKLYTKPKDSVFPNLLITETPLGIGDIYASDFTYLKYHGRWVYVATVIDVFTREIKESPKLNPSRKLITGMICGVRVEEVEDEIMREIRYLDKLIDELANGRSMEKIMRKSK